MQLGSDTRTSIAVIPPSYSQALDAPIPSEVFDMVFKKLNLEKFDKPKKIDNKFQDADTKSNRLPPAPPDTESLRRVTLNFEPEPPTYEEVFIKK